ncbi:uncharacterized protein LOC130916509 isoform X2 [Corythoichthys intestinalis]|uniref:uncharacterized protein LOC130916509 isoform X2 n=1 Tax=Corythoichthys intestinalis TaxID=161448 RepID=UPI0025A5AAC4|nr:uncharacterized protein LOC130916509 isoform X2 [Corythoichthys intestinalis]
MRIFRKIKVPEDEGQAGKNRRRQMARRAPYEIFHLNRLTMPSSLGHNLVLRSPAHSTSRFPDINTRPGPPGRTFEVNRRRLATVEDLESAMEKMKFEMKTSIARLFQAYTIYLLDQVEHIMNDFEERIRRVVREELEDLRMRDQGGRARRVAAPPARPAQPIRRLCSCLGPQTTRGPPICTRKLEH